MAKGVFALGAFVPNLRSTHVARPASLASWCWWSIRLLSTARLGDSDTWCYLART